MKFLNSIKYIITCMLIYFIIFVLEILLFGPLLDGLTDSYLIKLIIYALLMITINPIFTFYITENLAFNPEGLKAPNGLEGALKKKIELFDEEE